MHRYVNGHDRRRDFMALFCGEVEGSIAPVLGDAMNSGATADPSFYPTHPNIDRLFQHRLLKGMTGTDYWPNGDRNDPRYPAHVDTAASRDVIHASGKPLSSSSHRPVRPAS